MDSKRHYCEKCGNEMAWVDCYNCEDGYSDHDCGEDCCCCLYPEPNVTCDVCEGEGGWYICVHCAKPETVSELFDDGRLYL